jgi:hypothetical protein
LSSSLYLLNQSFVSLKRPDLDFSGGHRIGWIQTWWPHHQSRFLTKPRPRRTAPTRRQKLPLQPRIIQRLSTPIRDHAPIGQEL